MCVGKEPAIYQCSACNRTGRFVINGCPLKVITPDIWEARAYFEFVENGLGFPVAGGALEQSESFLDGLGAFRRYVGMYQEKR